MGLRAPLDPPARQVHGERGAREVNQAVQENQAEMVYRDSLVPGDQQDLMVLQAHLAHRENRGSVAAQAPLAQQAHGEREETLAQQDPRVLLDLPDLRDPEVLQGPRELAVSVDSPVRQEKGERLAQQGLQVPLARMAGLDLRDPLDPGDQQDLLVLGVNLAHRVNLVYLERQVREDLLDSVVMMAHQDPKASRVREDPRDQLDPLAQLGQLDLMVSGEREVNQAKVDNQDLKAREDPEDQLGLQAHKENRDQEVNQVAREKQDHQDPRDPLVPLDGQENQAYRENVDCLENRERGGVQEHLEALVIEDRPDHLDLAAQGDQMDLLDLLEKEERPVKLGREEMMADQGLMADQDHWDPLDHQELQAHLVPKVPRDPRDQEVNKEREDLPDQAATGEREVLQDLPDPQDPTEQEERREKLAALVKLAFLVHPVLLGPAVNQGSEDQQAQLESPAHLGLTDPRDQEAQGEKVVPQERGDQMDHLDHQVLRDNLAQLEREVSVAQQDLLDL